MKNHLEKGIQSVQAAFSKGKQEINSTTAKCLAMAMLVVGATSCKKDEPIEAPNKAPDLVVNALNVNDTNNTISFDADGTDTDGSIANYTAFVTKTTGEEFPLSIDNNGKTNQEITNTGKYNQLTVNVTDNDGAITKVEKPINLTVENITTTFKAETTIATNAINEETHGKIATLTTVVNKIVNTDGTEVSTPATGGTISYTITGPDANLLEIKNGNEVHVKENKGKNVEDADGNDIDANKHYDFGIDTNVPGLEGGNTATDTDTAADTPNAENIDIDDFAPFPGLVVEHNGNIKAEYTNTVNNANNLSNVLAPRTSVAILDNIANAGGSRFTRTTYNIAGFDISHLTIDGKRLGLRSMSWLLDAVDACRLSGQTVYTLMKDNTEVAQKIADILKTLTFVDYSSTTADTGAQMQIDSKLTAAKIGAGATVNYNIVNGNY